MKNKNTITLHNLLLFIALLAFWGGTVYRAYRLNWPGIIIALILAVTIFFLINRLPRPNTMFEPVKEKSKHGGINFLFFIFYLLFLIASFFLLFTHRTDASLISPWQVLPSYFFIFYALTALSLLSLTIKPYNNITIFLFIPFYFLSFSVTVFIYALGYGFDPFIHQATEKLIALSGAVDPKPFYYLGQYSLVVIAHKLTALPIGWLDRLLVPVLAAVFLPPLIYRVLKNWLADNAAALAIALVSLVLPFSFFIFTTPQNLAYFFLLSIILLGLACSSLYELFLIYALALAALITQPIAGLPALLFAFILTVFHGDRPAKKTAAYVFVFILTAVSLPLLFYFLQTDLPAANIDAPAPSTVHPPRIPGQENAILNFIYLYGFNLKAVIIALSLIGLGIFFRWRDHCRVLSLYLLMAAALLGSYYLTVRLPFDFLISYERGDYPNRLLTVAAFFLSPFILLAFYAFIHKLKQTNKFFLASFGVFGVILLASSLYLSYPRFDHYHNSRGYSTGQSDIEAVRWIAADATSTDYIVLANQQVSAAALQESGFKKYFKSKIENQPSEIFYYPIPTASPLYQYYLDMVYEKPGRQTVVEAMDLVNVDTAYFVLNKYWWAFPKVAAEAKLEADSYTSIDKDAVVVFKYVR